MTIVGFRLAVALFAVLGAAALTAGCDDTPTAPGPNAPFSQVDLRIGAGAAAAVGNTLVIDYTGWLFDPTKTDNKGLQFETSIGRTPIEFVLGQGNVIAGWDQGLVGLRVGGLRRLTIPPSLAYGKIRQGPIPANAGLVFDVELVEIK